MLAPKKHILINGFVENKNFQSKVRGRTKIPAQNRQIHGEHLLRRYDELINESKNRSVLEENPITGDIGIYVKIVSFPGVTLPLNHLDTKKSFKLCSCSKENECETAVIFIPESKRGMFKEKLNEYLNPQEDRTPKNQTKENVAKLPKNRTLIDSIADIKLANLQSFWTDNQNDFPTDNEIQMKIILK